MSVPHTSSNQASVGRATPPPFSRLGWWRWLLVIAYMAFIFTGSAQSTLPELPGQPSDKLLHFTEYGLLSWLVVWAAAGGAWRTVGLRHAVIATLVSATYGWSDEIHQLYVPGRQFDLHDLAADTLGAAGVASLAWAWGIISRGRDRQHG